MHGRSPRRLVWILLSGWIGLAAIPAVRSEERRQPSPASRVSVSIWEGLPKGWKFTRPAAAPNDQFEGPAMAFVRLPLKYNARGIEVDRVAPFALHAETSLAAPAGAYRLMLRSRNAARLLVDGRVVCETKPINPNSSGHEEVPEEAPPEDPRWRYVATGDQEVIAAWTSDGKPHRVELWTIVGERKLRHETGELSVSLIAPGGVPRVLGEGNIALTDESWTHFAAAETERLEKLDTLRRHDSARSEDAYWEFRHEIARRETERRPPPAPPRSSTGNLVDRYLADALKDAGVSPSEPVDDASFLRRLTLDTLGTIPTEEELRRFLADRSPDKRARAVDARLTDPRWADAWMGYWQDVLGENPGILKPTLNNTGPFRRFLHTALADNTPADRFVTELIRMEGSPLGGGPAGFGIASQNDAPMAAKAQILAKAFLAAEMKCARCHDAPSHPYDQADLFGLAGLLEGKPIALPATSTVKSQPGGRVPAVSVSLQAGEVVEPHWNLTDLGDGQTPADLLPPKASSRDRLALMITGPANTRFAPVLVNRLWKRFLGVGLVEPVDDWDNSPKILSPVLLDALARELATHGYDLKHVARLILTSEVYQAKTRPTGAGDDARMSLAALPARRRLTAEQVLDSMFDAVGKPFRSEELNLDPDGRRPPTEFLNLGVPRRSWQFTSLSNERDRPALSLPVAQSLVDVLETFGWRSSRQDAVTERDETTTPLQPAMLANGTAANRAARLSDDSAITALCLENQPAAEFVRDLYIRLLSREPSESEIARSVEYLGSTYTTRVVPGAKAVAPLEHGMPARRVSWSNHLSPEATRIQLAMEKAARAGDPPTGRLTPEFRERAEDLVWALLNSPEFVFLP